MKNINRISLNGSCEGKQSTLMSMCELVYERKCDQFTACHCIALGVYKYRISSLKAGTCSLFSFDSHSRHQTYMCMYTDEKNTCLLVHTNRFHDLYHFCNLKNLKNYYICHCVCGTN